MRLVGINTDDSLEVASKASKEEGFDTLELLNIGSSSMDLEYGSNMMPRVVLVDTNGHIAYIGLPSKINLQNSIETLIKGEKLALAPEDL